MVSIENQKKTLKKIRGFVDSEFVKTCHEHVIHAAKHSAMSMKKLFISIRISIVFFLADIFLPHDEIFLTFKCEMAEMAKRSSGQAIWF